MVMPGRTPHALGMPTTCIAAQTNASAAAISNTEKAASWRLPIRERRAGQIGGGAEYLDAKNF
jgi:hypothetical protein